jgi:hypothetical protein
MLKNINKELYIGKLIFGDRKILYECEDLEI